MTSHPWADMFTHKCINCTYHSAVKSNSSTIVTAPVAFRSSSSSPHTIYGWIIWHDRIKHLISCHNYNIVNAFTKVQLLCAKIAMSDNIFFYFEHICRDSWHRWRWFSWILTLVPWIVSLLLSCVSAKLWCDMHSNDTIVVNILIVTCQIEKQIDVNIVIYSNWNEENDVQCYSARVLIGLQSFEELIK